MLDNKRSWSFNKRQLWYRIFRYFYIKTPKKLWYEISKPYPFDYRRNKNAELILINQLKLTYDLLKKDKVKPEEIAIGFFDETSPQTTANTVKVWSFGKPKIYKNTDKIKLNAAGFYPLKGNSSITYLDNSKQEEICRALNSIRQANMEYKAIVVVIDNFSSHKTEMVLSKASDLGIYLVFLPPYSPDLNPIEFIWKSIKKIVSQKFIHDKKYFQEIFEDSFNEFSKKISFAKRWIEKILEPLAGIHDSINDVKLCA